jgi:hypothetical protein
MLTLAINTASKQSALALIKDSSVLIERSWESNANESQKVLPGILEMLTEKNLTWKDLDEVFVANGPGAYTSLRVGIVIANSIAWQLKIPMRSTDIFTIWEQRIPASACAAVAAGRDKYLIRGSNMPQPLSELPENLYGETPKAPKPSKTFGQAVASIDLKSLPIQKTVEPFYVRPPDITIPKK